MHTRLANLLSVLALSLVVLGCDSATSPTPDVSAEGPSSAARLGGSYSISAVVFDIAAAPDGSILVAQNQSVKEIRGGNIADVVDVPIQETTPVSTLNGLAPIGRGSFFAASGGGDLATGAGVWRISRGNARLVADIEAFENLHDPDATAGPQWKVPDCEFNPDAGFSAGPQSNPFHLAALSGSEVLVADAAGNTLLSARTSGQVDWVAVFTPPTADGTASDNPDDWMVLFPLGEAFCYVQPVPTSVAVGPDGAYYVGELTGVTPADIGLGGGPTTGLSRIWRIEAGSRNVACPSADCEVVVSGLTSVIDLAFGPNDELYVVEYDENNWFAATVLGNAAGGTISRCDVADPGAVTCEVVEEGVPLPGAITFDKWGTLWVAESNVAEPTVRQVAMP